MTDWDDDWIRDHARSLRALGSALLGDAHAAQDVAQDALAAALHERGPIENLAAWLRTVARRRASAQERERAGRTARERRAARPERQASAADLAARAELVRRVAEAVGRLREPYRETLLLRFYEDLPPRAIAARQGVPVATVDSRLLRGLALARTELERISRGDAQHWRSSLALALGLPLPANSATPTAVDPPAPSTPLLLGGLIAMKVPSLLVAGIGLVGVALVVTLVRHDGERSAASQAVVEAAGHTPDARDGSAAPRPETMAGRAALSPPAAVEPAPPSRVARGVVLGPLGEPVAGAAVLLGAEDGALRAVATSDAQGRFESPCVAADRWIAARAEGFGPSPLRALEDLDGELRLYLPTVGASLDVLVVDDAGVPLADARVVVGRERERSVRQPDGSRARTELRRSVRTDAAGRARIAPLPPGWQGIAAQHERFAPARTFATLRVDAPNEVVLALERGLTVVGTVRAVNGAPVAGVQLARGSATDRVARSDAQGRFELGPVDAGKVVATAPDGREVETRVTGGPGETVRWDPVLTEEATLRGVVVDEHGGALRGWRVSAHHDTWPGWTRAAETDAGGRFAIHGCPDQPLRVELRAAADHALPALVVDGLRTGPEEHRLSPPSRRATVRGSFAGLRGATPFLQQIGTAQRVRLTAGPGAEVALDDDGAFVLSDVPPGRYRIVALGAPFGWLQVRAFELAGGDELDLGGLVLPEPGRVLVELERPVGPPAATAGFTLERREEFVVLEGFDGVFPDELSLAPGNYVLEVELTPGPRRELPFTVRAGEVTPLRVDLRSTCLHRVRMRNASGRPGAGALELEVRQLDLAFEHVVARTTVERIEDGDWLHELELESGRFRFTVRLPDGREQTRDVPLFSSEPGREVLLVVDDR